MNLSQAQLSDLLEEVRLRKPFDKMGKKRDPFFITECTTSDLMRELSRRATIEKMEYFINRHRFICMPESSPEIDLIYYVEPKYFKVKKK